MWVAVCEAGSVDEKELGGSKGGKEGDEDGDEEGGAHVEVFFAAFCLVFVSGWRVRAILIVCSDTRLLVRNQFSRPSKNQGRLGREREERENIFPALR